MKKVLIHTLVLTTLLSPFFVSAALFNPSEGLIGGICDDGQCQFNAIVALIKRIINFIFYVSVPLAALLFAYAGFLFLTAGPNQGQAEKAKGVFTNVAVGFGIILAAWLIVYTVSSALIEPNFFGDELPQLRQ